MRAVDGANFAGISATTAAFTLDGGKYGVICSATFGGGSVTLEILATDGSTWLTVGTAFSANGYQALDVVNGLYRLVVATATAVYVSVERIPGE